MYAPPEQITEHSVRVGSFQLISALEDRVVDVVGAPVSKCTVSIVSPSPQFGVVLHCDDTAVVFSSHEYVCDVGEGIGGRSSADRDIGMSGVAIAQLTIGILPPAPDGTIVIDGAGLWVTPGLIDVHSHMGVYPSPGIVSHQDGNEMVSANTAGV